MDHILAILSAIRAPLHDEKATQEEISKQLKAAGIEFGREVRLSRGDVVDFMIDGLAIEVKIKGNRAQIHRQLERYSQHESVQQIVLLTSRSILLPSTIGGKPTCSISLSRAWL